MLFVTELSALCQGTLKQGDKHGYWLLIQYINVFKAPIAIKLTAISKQFISQELISNFVPKSILANRYQSVILLTAHMKIFFFMKQFIKLQTANSEECLSYSSLYYAL